MKHDDIVVEAATPADGAAIAALLRAAELPHEDVAPHLANFVVARAARGTVVGAVGAERRGEAALLGSLVVAPERRGAGLGGRLVDELDKRAGVWGVKTWWLLTTSAERFFAARGFRVTERSEAPEEIRRTGQFSGGCCGSAVCMTRDRVVGEATEFDAGATEFRAKLRAFLRRRVRDDATADDLTQDTLLKVLRSRALLRDDRRLEAWLYRIARTTLIDFYRRQRPMAELPEGLAGEAEDEVGRFREAVIAATKHFLEELPAAYREPVRLAELEGLPLAKIALRSGLSLTAVKSRVRRGRAMLKKKLQDCCRFEFDRGGKAIGWESRQPTPCAC